MKKIKTIIVLIILLLLFFSFFFFIQMVDLLLSIQQKYQDAPTWLIIIYLTGIIAIALIGIVATYRLLKFSRHKADPPKKQREVYDDQSYQQKLSKLESIGADSLAITDDFKALQSIRQSTCITMALFGEINTGKSSLVSTLTSNPVAVSAKGGQTQSITDYLFEYKELSYQLFDMPGILEVDRSEESLYQKAIQSHVIIFVTQTDITRSVYQSYEKLMAYKKPIIIAINKKDLYQEHERELILERFCERFPSVAVVWVSSTHQKQIERHLTDGSIEISEQTILGDVSELITAIETIALDKLSLDHQLNNSYFQLLEEQMDKSLSGARYEKSKSIIRQYSYKAVFGGMASVSPGTDVLLQGYLGIGMAKSLCQLYDVDMKSIDFDSIMHTLGGKMQRELTVILALVGNVFKAFPGVGTVAGGTVHAIAYGLIFDAVGQAMVSCLEKENTLDQSELLTALEGRLDGYLEKRAKDLVKNFINKKE